MLLGLPAPLLSGLLRKHRKLFPNVYSNDGVDSIFSGVELGIGTSLTSRNIGTSDSDYSRMSLGIGYETYIGETVISLGGGVEKATNKVDDLSSCLDADLVKAEAATSADAFFDGLYGGSPCGDELLSAIGMELSIDNYTLSSAFSHLNTDNADSNVWSVGFGSSVKDVDYTVGFTQESLDYARDKTNNDKVEDTSTTLSLDASKPLNESLDLGLNLSSSETDNMSHDRICTSNVSVVRINGNMRPLGAPTQSP